MKFKKVHGLGRADYAKKALDAAMSNLHNPEYVDAWIAWFDKQPDDTQRSQCEQCAPCVVCPDDCPQPEFYMEDLEEVAHAVVSRVESELFALANRLNPGRTDLIMDDPVMRVLNAVRGELSEPGYVEGLLPQ
ncbi:hypothetical protein [Citrobacter freundii]|uniref:hypothetical protein n=1 Tax=Citrobacter freundii TaxID=546 RepID=UPI001867D2A1|nr:hypothetical protein [Citrobacter freundii]